MTPLRLIITIAIAVVVAVPCLPICAVESKTARVAPTDKAVVVYDKSDSGGEYDLPIVEKDASAYTIKDSNFRSQFKNTTLWKRESERLYKLSLQSTAPPHTVGIDGIFTRKQVTGGRGSALRNDFTVDAVGTSRIELRSYQVSTFSASHHLNLRVYIAEPSLLATEVVLRSDADGSKYFTIGAEPTGALGTGLLKSEMNRSRDLNDSINFHSIVHATGGQNIVDVINALIAADSKYGDDLTYEAKPEPEDPNYNSNSYISGLLRVIEVALPSITVDAPGYDKPVPAGNFQ